MVAAAGVPTVDVAGLAEGKSKEERGKTVEQIRKACTEVGFFYATNHGVNGATIDATIGAAEDFFGMTKDQKLNIDNVNSSAFRGYIAQGLENTNGVVDEREQVEFGPDDEPAERDAMPYYLRLKGPNQWPDDAACPGFRPSLDTFASEMEQEARRLTAALAEALGEPADVWETEFDNPFVQMKICRYPGMETPTAGVSGVGAHSDSGFLSMLVQDDAGGLQVQIDGEWVDVPPLRHAIVVNLGEMLQLMSGGSFKATVHRVLRSERNRISIPYFWNPNLDVTMAGLGIGAAARSSATHGGTNEVYEDYGTNAFKSLARSHPRVLARHHPDLALIDGRVVVRARGNPR